MRSSLLELNCCLWSLDFNWMYSNHLNFEQQQMKFERLRLLDYFDCVQRGFLYTGDVVLRLAII